MLQIEKLELLGSPVEGHPGVRQLVHTPVLIYYRVDEARKLVEVLHSGTVRPGNLSHA